MSFPLHSIFRNVQFEKEIPEQFEKEKLPTLDFNMWLQEVQLEPGQSEASSRASKQPGPTTVDLIMYSFYKKPMNSKYCIMEKSALPENTKTASLSQDLIRRMLNTSERISQVERNEIIEKYIEKLEVSGYNKVKRKKIIEAGLKGYQAKVEKSQRDGTDLHRAAETTIANRYKKKLMGKSNWFKNEKKESNEEGVNFEKNKPGSKKTKVRNNNMKESSPVSVIFVPRTPGGELVTRLRQAEAELYNVTGDKIKFVEKSGAMLKNILHKNNPHAGESCGRLACLVCSGGAEGSGDCKSRNITYKTSCLACLANGKEATYYGETCRTAYERGLEHSNDHISMKEDSHMHRHEALEHGDKKVEFSMKVIRQHKSAFQRQVHEAVVIEMNETKNILNAKGEYNRCSLPRLGTMLGEREIKEKLDREKEVQRKVEDNDENEIDEDRHRKRKESINAERGQVEEEKRISKRRRIARNPEKMPSTKENPRKRKRKDEVKELPDGLEVKQAENLQNLHPPFTEEKLLRKSKSTTIQNQKLENRKKITFLPKIKTVKSYEKVKLSPMSKPRLKPVKKSGESRKLKYNLKEKSSPSQAQLNLMNFYFKGGTAKNASRVEPENNAHSSLSPASHHHYPQNKPKIRNKFNSDEKSKCKLITDHFQSIQNVTTQKTSTNPTKDANQDSGH